MGLLVGKRFLILKESESVEFEGRISIVLGPSRAFGSGGHETTRSCLEEMENLPAITGSSVLDLGCGTGILSIAAAKLGADMVTAVDPDPDAIETTVANIRLNHLEKMVFPIFGKIDRVKEKNFDIILANLYGDVLLALSRDLTVLLKPGGRMILSGIHYDYGYELRQDFLRVGCRLLKTRCLDDYLTMIFRRQSPTI